MKKENGFDQNLLFENMHGFLEMNINTELWGIKKIPKKDHITILNFLSQVGIEIGK